MSKLLKSANMANTIDMIVSIPSKPKTLTDDPLPGDKHPSLDPEISFHNVDYGDKSFILYEA